jgi:hypothetical protein
MTCLHTIYNLTYSDPKLILRTGEGKFLARSLQGPNHPLLPFRLHLIDAHVRPTGPSTSTQRVSKMADAPEKNAGPSSHPAKSAKKVSFSRKAVGMDAGAGEAPKWKKKLEAHFRLDHLQEEASNHVSTAMAAFVQRTSIVKEVCTPSCPQAPWRILMYNPLWSSKRNYCKLLNNIAPSAVILCSAL